MQSIVFAGHIRLDYNFDMADQMMNSNDYQKEALRTAGENPDIPFYIVANDGIDEKNIPKNIFFMGTLPHEELFELYKKTSILLRVPEHDGLPVMMLEAQGIGRTVIHNIGFPYVVTPKDRTNISLYNAFREIVSLPPKLDVEAKRYVEETFSPDKILMLYRSIGVIG